MIGIGPLRVIGARFGQHSSSEAFHELAIGVGARESAHDAHDRFEGSRNNRDRSSGRGRLNKSAAKTAPLRTSQPVSTVERTDMAISPTIKTLWGRAWFPSSIVGH